MCFTQKGDDGQNGLPGKNGHIGRRVGAFCLSPLKYLTEKSVLCNVKIVANKNMQSCDESKSLYRDIISVFRLIQYLFEHRTNQSFFSIWNKNMGFNIICVCDTNKKVETAILKATACTDSFSKHWISQSICHWKTYFYRVNEERLEAEGQEGPEDWRWSTWKGHSLCVNLG